jgi:hypothetical protein
LAALLLDSVLGACASWAKIPTLTPSTIAAHIPDNVFDLMVPPVSYQLGGATLRPTAGPNFSVLNRRFEP